MCTINVISQFVILVYNKRKKRKKRKEKEKKEKKEERKSQEEKLFF